MRFFLLSILFVCGVKAQTPDHTPFSELLSRVVDTAGMVDYTTLEDQQGKLKAYLVHLEEHQPKRDWIEQDILAYWINTYNAYTLQLIVEHYPLASIKDIRDPWKRKLIPFKDQMISLDHVEHDILRKMGEPRIHFAINCASISCPVLQAEAYEPDQLEQQLDNAARRFINDPTRNMISSDSLRLSKLFKWFRKDFTQNGTLREFIARYAEKNFNAKAGVSFLDYNWNLNGQ